jgi:hypothetical protein
LIALAIIAITNCSGIGKIGDPETAPPPVPLQAPEVSAIIAESPRRLFVHYG